ncbi:MAG: hypothetical protein MUC48_02830 [Leptolyngbya sp. Prado105]|jgi:hypothetical protein|nr:hypothetical protein [Leptolyngbya sp. Prado105]
MSIHLLVQQPELDLTFSEQAFDRPFNFVALDQTVEAACATATQHPRALYLFMQRYTHFNGAAGSLVARLASSIGLSRELFREPACELFDEADRGLEVAAKVLSATIDEHSDAHHKGCSHRTLAQATLKAVGNYAALTDAERNSFATVPTWLTQLLEAAVVGYQGIPGDLEALIRAMGVHAASEMLAAREYAVIDKVVRYTNAGLGFDQYLKDGHGQVELNGQKISAWYWIAVHGSHKEAGVETDHAHDALEALTLAMQYCTLPNQQVWQLAFEGFEAFVTLQQTFFQEAQKECLDLIKTEMGSLI